MSEVSTLDRPRSPAAATEPSDSTASTRIILGVSFLLQLVWLGSRWWSHTDPHWQRIPLVGICTIVLGVLAVLVSWGKVNRWCGHVPHRMCSGRYLIPALLVGCLLLGVVTARVQVVYTDELVFQQAAEILSGQGLRNLLASYSELGNIGQLHPPLVTLLHGAVGEISTSLFALRLVSLAFAAGTLWLTFLIGRSLYSTQTGLMAVLMLMSLRYFAYLGCVANNDMAVAFFFTLGIYCVLQKLPQNTTSSGMVTGLAIGLGLLSKYTMAIIYPVSAVMLVLRSRKQGWPVWSICLVGMVSLSMLGCWLAVGSMIDVTGGQLSKVSRFAGCVAGTSYGRHLLVETLAIRLPSAIGFYNIPFVIAAAVSLIIRRGPQDKLLLAWIGVGSICVLATLPVNRYFLPIFPALALMISAWLTSSRRVSSSVVVLGLLNCALSQSLYIDLP